MISAATFARDHASTWRGLTPTADVFVRRLNLNLYEREFRPLKSVVEPERRALVNEIAFRLFAISTQARWTQWAPPSEAIGQAVREVQRANEFYAAQAARFMAPSKEELDEALLLLDRLRNFFIGVAKTNIIETSPKFAGCGILDTCAGDVFFRDTLFEVKAGDRFFRSIDLRQLLIYAALNRSAQSRQLINVGLFNPRVGISFRIDLDALCTDIAGRPSAEVLDEIIRIVSSGDISR